MHHHRLDQFQVCVMCLLHDLVLLSASVPFSVSVSVSPASARRTHKAHSFPSQHMIERERGSPDAHATPKHTRKDGKSDRQTDRQTDRDRDRDRDRGDLLDASQNLLCRLTRPHPRRLLRRHAPSPSTKLPARSHCRRVSRTPVCHPTQSVG